MLRRAALCLLTGIVLAGAVEAASPDTGDAPVRASTGVPSRPLPPGDSAGPLVPGDSLRARPDSLRDTTRRRKAVRDTAAARKGLPPRLLSFEDQFLFGMVFMSFLALMLTSLTNVNP